MRFKLSALQFVLVASILPATAAMGQISVTYQNGVTLIPGGTYDGTFETELRAANPTESQAENEEISIDEFDAGFQTQAAIRFGNLLVSQGGVVPSGLAREDILFAELRLWGTSSTDADANIDFHRVVGPDTTSGAFWEEDDTWASLGGDLIPDDFGLLDGDPILANDIEARSVRDFQVDPLLAASDSGDLLAANLDAGQSVLEAFDSAFFRFNATEAVRDWLVDGDPNFGWVINNDTGNGWDFLTSEFSDVIDDELAAAGLLPEHFRPALTIVYIDGPILDLDGDDDVDESDFGTFLELLASELDGPIPTGSPGDFDFNRRVDLNDFKFFKQSYAEQHAMFPPGSGSFGVGVVPEPASAVLMAMALCGLAGRQRRRVN
jgi:hypothetical protein